MDWNIITRKNPKANKRNQVNQVTNPEMFLKV